MLGERGKLVIAAVACGAAVATTAIAAAGDGSASRTKTKVLGYSFGVSQGGTAVKGVGYAQQRSGSRRVRVVTSLHGLAAGTYTVLASKQPCSKAQVVDGADFLVWRTNIIMANTEGDFHVKAARLRAKLRTARSVRVYMKTDGSQVACTRAFSGDVITP